MLFNLWAHLSYFLTDFSLYLILLLISFGLLVAGSYKVYKSNSSPKRKKLLVSVFFTLFCLILIFSFFEAYFRYRYDISDGLGFLKVNQRWQNRHIVFNSDFFRDRNFGPKKENTTRICAIGDSVTQGGGIKKVNDRFTNLLENKLQNAGYSAEVYNLGKSGYDTDGEKEIYEKTKFLNCDIVVWEYFLNDVQPEGQSTGTRIIANSSKESKIASSLSNRSFFFDYLYWRLSTRYTKTFKALNNADLSQYNNPPVFTHHLATIKAWSDEMKTDNKKVIVIIFPFVHLLPNYPAAEIHQRMDKAFQDNGLNVIDLLDDLKGKNGSDLIASKFDYHPNETVHKIAADRLFEEVKKLMPSQNSKPGAGQ